MRAPIWFYVSRYREGARRFAVPVHLMHGTGPWQGVRALAGRSAGRTFTIVTNDLYSSLPDDARLVSGSREAIAKFGPRQLEELALAHALQKRIGQRRLSERQLQNAFKKTMQLAESVRRKTPNDRAWFYFDRDLEEWRSNIARAGRLISMLDMVRGAAQRYQPPSADKDSPAYARAVDLQDYANGLSLAISAPSREAAARAPRRWLEVADALEVAEDAWREAGDDDRADNARVQRHNILTTIRLAYEPRRRR